MEHLEPFRRIAAGVLSYAFLLSLTACVSGGAEVTSLPEATDPAAVDAISVPAPEAAQPVVGVSPFTYGGLAEKVETVLADLVTADMTQLEQARAVYDYTRTHISYSGGSEKSDWEQEAYVGLTTRRGDCFTYYAVARALLSELGISNIAVERVGGVSDHYWLLVDCGEGWYHFDPTPRRNTLPPFDSFMFTDADAANYTAATGDRAYYAFDGSLYPERATQPNPENAH